MIWVCLTSFSSQLFAESHVQMSLLTLWTFDIFWVYFLFEFAFWIAFGSQAAISPCSRMTNLTSLYFNSWRLRHIMLVKLLILWLVRLFRSLTSLISWAVRVHLSFIREILFLWLGFHMLLSLDMHIIRLWPFRWLGL